MVIFNKSGMAISAAVLLLLPPVFAQASKPTDAQASKPTDAQASKPTNAQAKKPVIADVSLLQEAGIEVLATHAQTGVGFAEITLEQERTLSLLAHDHGKCGGFEALPYQQGLSGANPLIATLVFGQLSERDAKDRRFTPNSNFFSAMDTKPEITAAVAEVSADNLRKTVEMMSAFNDRYNQGDKPNDGVMALKAKIDEVAKAAKIPVTVELVDHNSTKQKSIHARITGSTRPNEIVVLGAHLDSINQSWFGNKIAPGADDNASGSANILEALRILSQKAQPERTVDFFWYAGEESGLLGSAEIATTYKKNNADVVGVLQLDMTLFPGDGEFTLGSMNDYTSKWLRSYLEELNTRYIKAKIVDDKCGYGCSDHASWHRQGYPALMPFESSFDGMNHNLHTSKDVIDSKSNFNHSAMFSKIAIAIAMDLGNSTLREQN
jgi:leucyl aminopeptidase